jgi:hypothetical protein
MNKKKVRIVCKYCGSERIRKDADAVWDVNKQKWVLCAVYDNQICEDCGSETSTVEVEIKGE